LHGADRTGKVCRQRGLESKAGGLEKLEQSTKTVKTGEVCRDDLED
jgi:hypothetical protein